MKNTIKALQEVVQDLDAQLSEMPIEECLRTPREGDKFALLVQTLALVEDALNKIKEVK